MVTGLRFIKDTALILVFISIMMVVADKYYKSGIINYSRNISASLENEYSKYLNQFEINKTFNKYTLGMISLPIKNKAESVPILVYHGITRLSEKEDIAPEVFEEQMFALKKAGYETITLEEYILYKEGKIDLPDKSFMLTFDDGLKSSFYKADPILQALNYNAVIFVISKYSLSEKKSVYYLSREELKELMKTGRWEIQAHANNSHESVRISADNQMGHFLSNRIWLDTANRIETTEEYKTRIYKEFYSTKYDLSKALGYDVNYFAFPFGDYGQDSLNMPNADTTILEIFQGVYPGVGFYQIWPSKGYTQNFPNEDESYLSRRIKVGFTWTGNELIGKLEKGKQKDINYKDDFSVNNGWITIWGNSEVKGGFLTLTNEGTESSGAGVFLDGTGKWDTNEIYLKAISDNNDSFSIMYNFKDTGNYEACTISSKEIRIEERKDGVDKIIVRRYYYSNVKPAGYEFRITRTDNNVICEDLKRKTSVKTPKMIDEENRYGGLGLKIWTGPKKETGSVYIKDLQIK